MATYATSAKQPDIIYHPDEAKWKARTARRLAEDPTLPRISSRLGGKDWTSPQYELSAEQLKEIDDALKYFKGTLSAYHKPNGYLSPETFPLPHLGPLHTGRGFFVIIIYAGVSSHVGGVRGIQERGGVVVGHIKDLTNANAAKVVGGPAYTADKQVFHTDAGDLVALFVLETAAEGGLSRISSSWKVYNEIAATRPDLIKTLSEPWPFDEFGGNPKYTDRPLLFHHDSKIIIQYARILFTGFDGRPRSADIPPITEAQAEALDTIHFLAEKYALGLSFQKGDIQFINNLSLFHARDGFRDSPEHKRHLLQLEESWKKRFYSTTPDTERFPLEPAINPLEKAPAT
ncbi:hypothetical protein BDZ97DRAFT_1864586 [Flammula alnicola]|nr:hypothetical protein BDZ97DRAFT_1864586 [Flammula alnicola]